MRNKRISAIQVIDVHSAENGTSRQTKQCSSSSLKINKPAKSSIQTQATSTPSPKANKSAAASLKTKKPAPSSQQNSTNMTKSTASLPKSNKSATCNKAAAPSSISKKSATPTLISTKQPATSTVNSKKSATPSSQNSIKPATSSLNSNKPTSGQHEGANKATQVKSKQINVSATKTKTSVATAISQTSNRVHPIKDGDDNKSSTSRNDSMSSSALFKLNLSVKPKQNPVMMAPTWTVSQSGHTPNVQQTQQRKSTTPTQQQGISGTCPTKQQIGQTEAMTRVSQETRKVPSSRLPRPIIFARQPMVHDTSKANPSEPSRPPSASQHKPEAISCAGKKTVVTHQTCTGPPCQKQNLLSAGQKVQTTSRPQEQHRQPLTTQQTSQVAFKTQASTVKQGGIPAKQTAATPTMVVAKQNGTSVCNQQKGTLNTSKAQSGIETGTLRKQTKDAMKPNKSTKSKQLPLEEEIFMVPIQQLTKYAAKHLSDLKNSQKKTLLRKLKPSAKKITTPLQSGEVPVCFLIKEHCEEFSIGYSDDEDEDDELETLLRSMLTNKILGWNAFQGLLYRYYKGKTTPRNEYPRLASCTKGANTSSCRAKIISEITSDVKMTKKQRKRKAKKDRAREEKESAENKQSDSKQTQMEKILFSNKPEQELQNQKSNMSKPSVKSGTTESLVDRLNIDITKPPATVPEEPASKPDQLQSNKIQQPTAQTNQVKEVKITTKAKHRAKWQTAKQEDKGVDSILKYHQQLADKLTGAPSSKSSTPNGHSGTGNIESKSIDHKGKDKQTKKTKDKETTDLPAAVQQDMTQNSPNGVIHQPISTRLATGDASSNRQGLDINNKNDNKSGIISADVPHVPLPEHPGKHSAAHLQTTTINSKSTNGDPDIATKSSSTTSESFTISDVTFTTDGPTTTTAMLTSKYIKGTKANRECLINARRFGKAMPGEGGCKEGQKSKKITRKKDAKNTSRQKDADNAPQKKDVKNVPQTKDAESAPQKKDAHNAPQKKVAETVPRKKKKIEIIGPNGKTIFKVRRRISEKTKVSN